VFVDPKSKLVMVHTAARDVGDAGRETLPLWLAIVKTLAKRGGSSLPTIAHRA
jgi:hypothetical protein